LQVTLCALQAERSLKSIIFTSSIEREGKSTLCANLGAAMAQAGQRVLLIDANLNHPYQHELWELPNEIGVTNILLGQVDSQQALQTGMNRLDVMTAGTTVSHPAALLENQPIAALLQALASYYDWILIDTPAINRSADGLIWSNAADGILLTVRPPILDTANAALANETLKISQQPLLGMVINAAETERKDYQYLTLEEPSPSDRLPPSDKKHQELADVSPSESSDVNPQTDDDEVELSLTMATVQPAIDTLEVTEEELLPIEGSLFNMPIKALQSHIDVLQQKWEASVQLTSDLEEEQELQEQLLSQLDSQINLARQLQHTSLRQNKELNRLKVRWTQECERMQQLSNTLSHQRTKLEQQQAQWEEAVSILTTRQRNMMSI
jgi:capsular exopolysaccharide synthesis family protein